MRDRYGLDRRAEPSGSGLDHLPIQAEPAVAAALGVPRALRLGTRATARFALGASFFVPQMAW